MESRELPCGCKISRSGNGMWFYDYLCEIHIAEVIERGRYSEKKAEELVKKLNEEMKKENNQSGYGVDVLLERKEEN